MRNAVTLLAIVLSIVLPCGCSTSRWSLAKKEDPPKPPKVEPEVEVKYGFPWNKSKKEEKKVASSQDLAKDLEEQLAKAKQSSNKQHDLESHLKLASAAEHKQDLATAQREYQAVLDADPAHAEAHHRLGVLADMQRKPDLADFHYSKAIAANRRNPDLLSDVGYSHSLRGNTEQAERFLKEAVEINPYHQQAWNNLGQLYGKQGQYDLAFAAFRKAGDDRRAQANMAEFFPNGRTNPSDIALANAQSPAPATQTSPGAAPPFPSDAEQPGSAVTFDQLKQRMEQERLVAQQQRAQKQLQEILPGVNENRVAPPANAMSPRAPQQTAPVNALNSGIVLQPSPGTMGQIPASPMPPGNAPPTNGTVQTMPPGPFSALLANTPGGAPAQKSPPAGQKYWQGGLNNQPAATQPPAQPLGPNPWANTPGAGFDGRPQMAAQNGGSPADAQRWAAQMAMGAGPGSMFPVVNPGPTAASSSRYASGLSPQSQQPIQQLNGTSSTEPGVENAVWWNDPSATGQQRPVNPALHQQEQPDTTSLAPQSPWNQWNTPAPQKPQWNVGPSWTGQDPTNSATPPNDGSFASPPNTLPAWPSNNEGSNTSGYRGQQAQDPRLSNGQPGAIPPTWPNQPGNAAPQSLPAQTTIQNWPYAPQRP